MPEINVKYDEKKVSQEEIQLFCENIYQITLNTKAFKEVFLYANSSQISINIAPIEVIISTGAHVMNKDKEIISKIKLGLQEFKEKTEFKHPINLTLIPMVWETEFNI